MKFRKDKDILRFLCIAVLLILTGVLMTSFLPGSAYFGIGSVLIIMGIIAIIVAIIAETTPKEDMIQDERSAKVDEGQVIMRSGFSLRLWRLFNQ